MISEFFLIAFYIVVGIVLVLAVYFLNWLLAPKTKPTAMRDEAYECGDPPRGSGWQGYNVRFYPFALLFVVFDIEAIFLFAWVAAFRDLGLLGVVEVMIFIAVLVVGLVYAWRKGVLRWI